MAKLLGDLKIDCIASVSETWRPSVIFGWRQAIVFVEVPAAIDWFVAFDEQAESHALQAIEVLHYERLLCFGPTGEKLSRRQKEIGVNGFDSELVKLPGLAKRCRLCGHRLKLAVLRPNCTDALRRRWCLRVFNLEAALACLLGKVTRARDHKEEPLGVPVSTREHSL